MNRATNHIRDLRENIGLSGKELALRAGLSQGHVSAIETGKRWPSAHVAFQIATILGVSIFDLGLNPRPRVDRKTCGQPAGLSGFSFKHHNQEGRRMPDKNPLDEFDPDDASLIYHPRTTTLKTILATRKKMRQDIVTALQASLQSGALEIPVCEDQDALLTAYESAMQEARNLLVLLTIARKECRRADENLQVVRATMKEIGERQAKSAAVEAENVNLKIEKFIEAVAQNVKNATVMEYEGTANDDAAVIHMTLKKSFNVILQDTFLAMFGPKEVAPATTTPDAPEIADETINLFPEDEPCVQ